MPANAACDKGVQEAFVQKVGFQDIRTRAFSQNVIPMLWLIYLIAFIPYLFIRALGLEPHFVNTAAGVESYRDRDLRGYIQLRATKPDRRSDSLLD